MFDISIFVCVIYMFVSLFLFNFFCYYRTTDDKEKLFQTNGNIMENINIDVSLDIHGIKRIGMRSPNISL